MGQPDAGGEAGSGTTVALAPVARLVVVAPNWLGDAVMALPAVADIRRAWPDTTLTVAARKAVAPLFGMVPGIHSVVSSETLSRETAYDAALLLTNSFRSAWSVWRAGIPERWGYRRDVRGPLLTRAVTPPGGVHQARYYQELTRALGFAAGPLEPILSVPPALVARARELLGTRGWDGASGLVAMAPGAAYGSAKRWPAASFAEAARAFKGEGLEVVLVGSAADRPAGESLRRCLGNESTVVDAIGQTDLPLLAGVLAACRALVSNDSGAAHLGAALGVPVTVVFGPTDERATHPIGRRAPVVLTHDVWCRPCMLRECPLEHRCMRGIGAGDVVKATRRSM
jgi:heptosyltransferase-2